ncbi:MAG: DcaP family trimeric outer membrane transporter [Flavobacteriales bacterium]
MLRTGAATFLTLCLCLSAHAQTATDSIPQPPPLKAGWWLIPGTDIRMTMGGYIKLDLIHDLSPIGSPNFFDVSKIPTDGSTGSSTRLQAQETRLRWDFRRDSKYGEVRGYMEGDFYGGAGNPFRLRHAYVDIGGRWLVGQTWSTFMDENIIPPTLDYEKPAAYAFARHAMIRYTQPLGDKTFIALALEQPSASIQTPEPGKVNNPLPDFAMRARRTGKWGHVQLSGFLGGAEFQPDSGSTSNVLTYGVNLSGQVNFGKKDKFIYQGIYGPGLARYRFGNYAAPDSTGKIQAITGMGFTAGVLHHWSDAWSSFVMYNYGTVEPTDLQNPGDSKTTSYVAANLQWHFTSFAWAGVEYLHGTNENVVGQDGSADRIMLSVQMNIN